MTAKTEIITDLARLRAIGPDWDMLHHACGASAFSDHRWIMATAELYPQDFSGAQILTHWVDDLLVAAVPLARRVGAVSSRIRRPELAQTAMMARQRVGFHDILIHPAHLDVAPALLEALPDRYVDLTPLHRSAALSALTEAATARGWSVLARDEITTSIADLSDGWEPFLASFKGSHRKAMKKAVRKAEEAGAVVEITGTGGDDADILRRALDLSARTWKAQIGTDIGSNTQVRAFFERLFAEFAPSDGMRIYLLSLEGETAAASTYMLSGGTAYGLINDFDDRFRALGPGRVIVTHALEHLAADGIKRMDMLRSTAFTDYLSSHQDTYQRIRIFAGPSLARAIVGTEAFLKRASRRLRGDQARVQGRQKAMQHKGGKP